MSTLRVASRPQAQDGSFVVTENSPTAAESARRSLARFELAFTRQRNAMRAQLGLGDDELTTLLYLSDHDQLTQRELVEVSSLSRSGVGSMVQRLEDLGLVDRVPHPRDGRVRLLQLSSRGSEWMRRARGAGDDERRRLLAAWPDGDLEMRARVLSAMAEATERACFEQAGAGSTPAPAPGDWRRWA